MQIGFSISSEVLIGGLRTSQFNGISFQRDGFGPKKSSAGSWMENTLFGKQAWVNQVFADASAGKDSHHCLLLSRGSE